MSNLNANSVFEEIVRGVMVSAVFRGVFQRKAVFSMGTVNEGVRYAGAGLVYRVAQPVISGAVPQLGGLLPAPK